MWMQVGLQLLPFVAKIAATAHKKRNTIAHKPKKKRDVSYCYAFLFPITKMSDKIFMKESESQSAFLFTLVVLQKHHRAPPKSESQGRFLN